MVENLTTLLLVAFAGLGLLFGIVISFWVLAVLLKRSAHGAGEGRDADDGPVASGQEQELRRQAAVAAVAIALALQAEARPPAFSLPPPVLVSTWQAVQRARLLSRARWRREG